MIAIFEGPQGAGKTTLINEVTRELERREVPTVRWKVDRGPDPIADMNNTLDSEPWTDDRIYLLDRFHLSELVISRALNRGWKTDEEWDGFKAKLKAIDIRLKNKGAVIVYVTASEHVMLERLDKLGKIDVIGSPEWAEKQWRWGITQTRCDSLHVFNNDYDQLKRNAKLIADLLELRWARSGWGKAEEL